MIFRVLIIWSLLFTNFVNSQQQIVLQKEQLLPLSHFTVDDYANYGRLIDGIEGLTNEYTYTPSDAATQLPWPHRILIDLRGIYDINKLEVHDGRGKPIINWYAGTTPFTTSLVAGPINLGSYDVYNTQNVDVKEVRYLILEQLDEQSRFPSEIKIYGTKISDVALPSITIKPSVDAKQILGSNGFLWEDPNPVGLFVNYRHFTEMSWFFINNEKMMVSPSAGGGVDLKKNINSFSDKGTESVLVLQNSPAYFMNKSATEHDRNYKPIPYHLTDYEVPTNWLDISKAYYRIAGYLGNVKVPVTDLNINTVPRWPRDVVNIEESGLNLSPWVEILNEPDKDWYSPQTSGYYKPYELAALMSAAYDGHQGTMLKAGVKTADPNMKVAMGGLYKLQVEYIKAMHEWAKFHRPDGRFPADAINFHHYNSNGGAQGFGDRSLPPEEGALIPKLQEIVDYRNQYLPDVEIWLSEWGMSTNQGDLKVPDLPSYGTREDVQGAWMIRTYLAFMKLNIDRSYMYATFDEHPDRDGTTLFGEVGIINKDTKEPKKSYYYVKDFVELFRGNNFKLTEDLSTAQVRDYVFEDIENNKGMRFVWSPTGNETEISDYSINISGNNINGFQFVGTTHGTNSYSNNISVTVRETPQVFMYDLPTLTSKPLELEQFTIFPNPISEKITINGIKVKTVTVFNMKGSKVAFFDNDKKNTETIQINLKKLPKGVYILKIKNNQDGIVSRKVIKR